MGELREKRERREFSRYRTLLVVRRVLRFSGTNRQASRGAERVVICPVAIDSAELSACSRVRERERKSRVYVSLVTRK